MKNYILYIFRSKININIKGPSIERFIKRLKSNNIDILSIIFISDNEINIKIYKSDYKKLINIKTIYEINILNYFGIVKYKNNLLDNKYIIISIFIGLIVLYYLSNIIFYIDIVTNDSRLESKIRNELKVLGIEKYKLKKNYEELQLIKKKILNNFKDEIDWIEIEIIGTKYIIKYEPRIIFDTSEDKSIKDIVALKDARIVKLDVISGQIVKEINSYVKKGDVIVSSDIVFNGVIKNTVIPKGNVYGEVWYKVTINYPYKYFESKLSGNKKEVLVVQFFSKKIELLNFKKFETKNVKDSTILKNSLLPIKLLSEQQFETIVIKENNTEEELINKAINYSTKKINDNLKEEEYIKNYKILNKIKYEDSIKLNIFYSVIENITKYEEKKEE